jgi:hypothetical protein
VGAAYPAQRAHPKTVPESGVVTQGGRRRPAVVASDP